VRVVEFVNGDEIVKRMVCGPHMSFSVCLDGFRRTVFGSVIEENNKR
jgi:hypothetical protein